MSLEQIIKVVVNSGYKYFYNEALGNFEFSNSNEVISVYDTGDAEVTASEIKDKFSFLF